MKLFRIVIAWLVITAFTTMAARSGQMYPHPWWQVFRGVAAFYTGLSAMSFVVLWAVLGSLGAFDKKSKEGQP